MKVGTRGVATAAASSTDSAGTAPIVTASPARAAPGAARRPRASGPTGSSTRPPNRPAPRAGEGRAQDVLGGATLAGFVERVAERDRRDRALRIEGDRRPVGFHRLPRALLGQARGAQEEPGEVARRRIRLRMRGGRGQFRRGLAGVSALVHHASEADAGLHQIRHGAQGASIGGLRVAQLGVERGPPIEHTGLAVGRHHEHVGVCERQIDRGLALDQGAAREQEQRVVGVAPQRRVEVVQYQRPLPAAVEVQRDGEKPRTLERAAPLVVRDQGEDLARRVQVGRGVGGHFLRLLGRVPLVDVAVGVEHGRGFEREAFRLKTLQAGDLIRGALRPRGFARDEPIASTVALDRVPVDSGRARGLGDGRHQQQGYHPRLPDSRDRSA